MALGRKTKRRDRVAGRLPAGHLVEDEQALEHLPVRLHGAASRLAFLTAGRRVADLLERGRGGGGRGVGRHPASQGGGVPDLVTELREIAVDDPPQVGVELRPKRLGRQFSDARETRAQDLGRVVLEPKARATAHRTSVARQERTKAHRRGLLDPFGERERPHSQADDAPAPRVGAARGRRGRPGQQVRAGLRAVVRPRGGPCPRQVAAAATRRSSYCFVATYAPTLGLCLAADHAGDGLPELHEVSRRRRAVGQPQGRPHDGSRRGTRGARPSPASMRPSGSGTRETSGRR